MNIVNLLKRVLLVQLFLIVILNLSPAFGQDTDSDGMLDDDDNCIFEREPLKRLAEDGQLVAYMHNGYWQCMDTYRDWEILEQDWNSKNPPWKVWEQAV